MVLKNVEFEINVVYWPDSEGTTDFQDRVINCD